MSLPESCRKVPVFAAAVIYNISSSNNGYISLERVKFCLLMSYLETKRQTCHVLTKIDTLA